MADQRFVFGLPWIDPSLQDGDEIDYVTIPTPVGDPCVLCGEDIDPADRGRVRHITIPSTPTCTLIRPVAVHAECDIRLTQGSWDHQTGTCVCHDGDGSRTQLNYREDAHRVVGAINVRRSEAGQPPLW